MSKGPATAGRKPPKKLPTHISEPSPDLFQVRAQRGKKVYSESFGRTRYGSRQKALQAAVAYRDGVIAEHPDLSGAAGQYARKPMSHKSSRLPAGVSRFVATERRKSIERQYLRYSVSWSSPDGTVRVKGFQVGPVEGITSEADWHAHQTAIACRQHWEYCRDHGLDFDVSYYRDWRNSKLYPFDPGKNG